MVCDHVCVQAGGRAVSTRLTVGYHVVQWVARTIGPHTDFGSACGIGLLRLDGGGAWRMIAGVAYADWNGPNLVAHIASDGSRRWMTREYLWTIFDYPFNQQGVRRVTCMIGEGNRASVNLCERLGFEQEARLQGAHPSGDLLVYRLFKERCKWISQDTCKRYARAA